MRREIAHSKTREAMDKEKVCTGACLPRRKDREAGWLVHELVQPDGPLERVSGPVARRVTPASFLR